jgi:plastocyanin
MNSLLKPFAALIGSVAIVVVAALPAAAADPQNVDIADFAFAPAEMTVTAGATVMWTNQDGARHTTTSDSGVWDSDVMARGATFSFVFGQVGDFAYHCDIHPDMLGIVHVTAAPAAAPAVEPEPSVEPVIEAVAEQLQPEPALEPATPAAPATSYYGY